jgi:hypothetical protein
LPFSLLALFRVLYLPWIVIAKIAIKGIDLFTRRKSRKGPKIGGEWVLFRPRGPQNGAAILEDELYAVPLPETQTVANFNGYGDLPLAADGAGRRHLYLNSKM